MTAQLTDSQLKGYNHGLPLYNSSFASCRKSSGLSRESGHGLHSCNIVKASLNQREGCIKNEILSLVRAGKSNNKGERALKEKIDQLISQPLPGRAADALKHGQGTWEVIHAPHISRLSSQLGTAFWPIQYRVEGSKIISNVQYSSSLFKEGWLSASGSVEASGTNTLQILFDKFWIDFGISNLREELPGKETWSLIDKLVMTLGRIGFLPQFSYFPVQYIDTEGELAVFSFPPLNSNITIMRVRD